MIVKKNLLLTVALASSFYDHTTIENSYDPSISFAEHMITGSWVMEDDSTQMLIIDKNNIIDINEIETDTSQYRISNTCKAPFEDREIHPLEWQYCLSYYEKGQLYRVAIIQNLTDSVLSLGDPFSYQSVVYDRLRDDRNARGK